MEPIGQVTQYTHARPPIREHTGTLHAYMRNYACDKGHHELDVGCECYGHAGSHYEIINTYFSQPMSCFMSVSNADKQPMAPGH